jgi:sarcosine oxidase
MTDFDIAIVGLGVMGSAAARALALRGARTVAFDRLEPPHTMGSSHGHTRIIREAYYEHPLYVPLVRRAYELWSELEREAGTSLFLRTGGIMAGPEDGPLFQGARESAQVHAVAHEILDARALEARFPAYKLRPGWIALLEHQAGMLFPERCVDAQIAGARRHGATVRLGETVKTWRRDGSRVAIETTSATYRTERLIVAAGPWLPDLRDSVGVTIPLEVERQLSHWFKPIDDDDQRYRAQRCPVGLWEMPDGDVFATLPDEGHGVKCGMHHAGATTSPDSVNRAVSKGENAVARELLETVMPGAGGDLMDARVCLYTNTPDRHFIIDWLQRGRILLLSPCSGHGFKFASAIGEIAAQMVLDDRAWLDLSPFSLDRFGRTS